MNPQQRHVIPPSLGGGWLAVSIRVRASHHSRVDLTADFRGELCDRIFDV